MRSSRAGLLTALLLIAATAAWAQVPGQPGPGQGPPQGPGPRGPRQGPGQGPMQGPMQGPGPGPMQGGPGMDPLMGNLFPPEMIMQNQQAINLTDEQRTYMVGEIQHTQAQSTAIQWRLQAAVERLGTLVRQERADEGQVLTQLDSVLAIEREMKRLQIGLLVRLKGRLTPEQQAFLRGRMMPRDD